LRTPRGRMLAEVGYRHIGIVIPRGAQAQFDLMRSEDADDR